MFIRWDGKVNPCDVDYRSHLSLGNIKDTNISKLWKSLKYNMLRQKHETKLINEKNYNNKTFKSKIR